MTSQLSEQQKNILKHFEQLQKDLQYQPISQSSLPHQNSNKQIQSQSSPTLPQNISSIQLIPYQQSYQMYDPQHKRMQQKLLEFKAKSNLVHSVSGLIHEYDINFKHLQKQRHDLLALLAGIHKDTSDLIYKQKKYIDLSNSMKEALDYYTLLDKFEFNWICEPAAREVFEDQLQPLLSELTDGIQFFTMNSVYSNCKKYLNGLVAAKTKVTSFIKSFFIKILNKQYGFSIKYSKNKLSKSMDGFYPKSKPKFLTDFITCFPQFQRELKVILSSARETGNQAETNTLLRRENQIEQFILNNNSLSLITYLQKNIPEVYEEAILKFISFYRINFHEALHKNIDIKVEGEIKYQDHFRQVFVQAVFLLTCQAGYLEYCFKPCTELARQYTRGTLSKISEFYSNLLVKLAKEPAKNKDPFKICNEVSYILEESDKFLRNYASRQYQTYAVGAIINQIEQFGIDALKSTFLKIGNKIISQLENVCQNMLPKFKQTSQKANLTEEIKQFVKMIPNLSYCPSQAEKYLITSLDSITKSIKQVSNKIESRLECYAWNIEMFALIDSNLERLPYNLIKKETRIDVGETTRMIQRVKSVSRSENLMKYASDIFSVIKTGVPTLSELTLDFNTFIKEYFKQLKEKFVKDMVFVHAKNVIEFLQQLKQATPEQALKLCEASMIKNLQSSYNMSIDNFISHANKIVQVRRKQFSVYKQGEELLISLLKQVQEALLDLMGNFYMEASKYSSETEKFQNIGELRSKYALRLTKTDQPIE